ncbi:hypothetical protein RM52_10270 [Microbacterium hominis]|uniref:Uncharacterized protein n=1 Tax=Microbacterium hominis TaxID=162426 RepID=A0A0B4CZC0_9MICO|nr:hypothetical protein RM52_10270 [Microbacterium hominis]
MSGHLEVGVDEPAAAGPVEESVCDEARGVSAGDPVVEVALRQILEVDFPLGEPVEELDSDGDALLAAQEHSA